MGIQETKVLADILRNNSTCNFWTCIVYEYLGVVGFEGRERRNVLHHHHQHVVLSLNHSHRINESNDSE